MSALSVFLNNPKYIFGKDITKEIISQLWKVPQLAIQFKKEGITNQVFEGFKVITEVISPELKISFNANITNDNGFYSKMANDAKIILQKYYYN